MCAVRLVDVKACECMTYLDWRMVLGVLLDGEHEAHGSVRASVVERVRRVLV